MPRERITTDGALITVGPDGYAAGDRDTDREEHEVRAPVFSIVWHKPSDAPVEGEIWLEALIQVGQIKLLAEGYKDHDDESWVHVDSHPLTRWQANNLIKQTRRARDGSLGSDE